MAGSGDIQHRLILRRDSSHARVGTSTISVQKSLDSFSVSPAWLGAIFGIAPLVLALMYL
jgi:hypothetical protein